MVPEQAPIAILSDLPLPAALTATGLAVLLWVAVHHARGRGEAPLFRGWRRMLAGALFGWIALAGALHSLQHAIVFTASWPLWIPAALGALGVECALALYATGRPVPTLAGRLPAIFRVALILLIALVLTQPVVVTERNRTIERVVAIVLDESPSMSIADGRMGNGERLRLAEALGRPGGKRPVRLETAAMELESARVALEARADWFGALQGGDEDARAEQLESERGRLHEFFKDQEARLNKVLAAVREARNLAQDNDGPREQLATIEARLDRTVLVPLAALAAKTRPESMPARWLRFFRERAGSPAATADTDGGKVAGAGESTPPVPEIAMLSIYDDARKSLTTAAETLADTVGALKDAGDLFDAALYRRLDEEARASVDTVAQAPREALARELLLGAVPAADGAGTGRKGLLEELAGTHAIRFYRLSDGMEEMELAAWRREAAEERAPETSPPVEGLSGEALTNAVFNRLIARETAVLADRRATDLRLALDRISEDIPSEQLEAVILLSDARHTAGGSPEESASQLERRGVPVHTVLSGARLPPVDAALVSVQAPDTVLNGDRVRFTVEVRLDGLTNRPVAIRLIGDTGTLDEKTVTAETDGERKRVELVHRPDRAGLHTYRIALAFDPAEAVATNNVHEMTVNVTEDPACLLLIEGRPNWEFRYLKNLFSGRDPWTRLQYVVMEPQRIPGQPEREVTVATAARAIAGETEATALPDSLEEWLKFDVVILGDVEPSRLRESDLEALRIFVTQRGGTLIVLAGPRAMPHAYGAGVLRDLLPVLPLRTDRALLAGPESAFRIRLTAEGEDSPILRLAADPTENLGIWESLPEIHWRQQVVRVRDGATVLAYAAPQDTTTPMPASDALAFMREREAQRAGALVVHHHAGLGNVLYFGFNHTWRMRYRIGDTFHHRLWGQVMRWATAYKMPFGTEFIRIGTGQARYAPGEPVRIRARLLRPDHSPAMVSPVVAAIRQGNKPLSRHEMRYIEGSPGIYETEVAALGPGTYTVHLEAPVDTALMNAFSQAVADHPPAFAVESGVGAEWTELGPDRGLASRLAVLSGGQVTEAPGAGTLRETLGPGRLERRERRQWDLWNHWITALLIGLLAGMEWLSRKREHLP